MKVNQFEYNIVGVPFSLFEDYFSERLGLGPHSRRVFRIPIGGAGLKVKKVTFHTVLGESMYLTTFFGKGVGGRILDAYAQNGIGEVYNNDADEWGYPISENQKAIVSNFAHRKIDYTITATEGCYLDIEIELLSTMGLLAAITYTITYELED